MSLKQNNLAEATTENGFPTEVGVPLQREVTLEDGTRVIVESITPEKMAATLKSHFVTPGEKYVDNGNNLNGVVQNYNTVEPEPEPEPEPTLKSITITSEPTKTEYEEGEVFDPTGMVITGKYDDGTSKEITEYTITPSGELTKDNTTIYIFVGELSADITITVNEKTSD